MGMETYLSTWVLATLILYLLYTTYTTLTRRNALDSLPWVAMPTGRLAKLRATFSLDSAAVALGDAYQKYSRKNDYFVMPSFMAKPKVVIPPSQVQWALNQPDDVLSFKTAVVRTLGLEYTALHPLIAQDPEQHHRVIRGELTRSLGLTVEPVLDELIKGLERYWGTDTEWTERGLWDSMTKVFAQTSNRIFVGPELCRNEDYLHNVVAFAEDLIVRGALLRPLPSILRTMCGWLLTWPNRSHFRKMFAYLRPVVEKRKANLFQHNKLHDPVADEPSDLLQWLILHAYKSDNESEKSSELICKRFAIVNFAAIHTTSLTSTNLLFDLLAASPEYNAIEKLREEINQVSSEFKGKWTKASLAKLVHMDSAIRESLRMHSAGIWGVHRTVVAKDGLTLPNGLHVPQDTDLATLGYSIQRDELNYENPLEYDPFRFSRAREAMMSEESLPPASQGECDAQRTKNRTSNIIKERGLAAVTTGNTFFAFGHGRHACPGRFFAVQEVKLLLMHILTNYELKPLDVRPPNQWFRDQSSPNTEASILFRKLVNPLK